MRITPPEAETRYVTRAQLMKLHDEIESILQRCEREISSSIGATRHAAHVLSENNKIIERMQGNIKNIEHALGIDLTNTYNTSLHDQSVTWSYFHTWVTRINMRLDDLDRRVQALSERATP